MIETNSMPFKSVLTALPLGFLEREREREGKILRLILKSIPLQKLILGILT